MSYTEVDFTGLDVADGLTVDEGKLLRQLVEVFKDRLANNRTRMEFYEDKNDLQNIGLTIPASIAQRVDTKVGWAAKAVDYLAARSIFDGFTTVSGTSEALDEVIMDNAFDIEYQKAVSSQLVHGVGFWTVSKGAEGEPKAIINYHNATSAAALWDFRHKRIKCGFVVEDYGLVQMQGGEEYQPTLVVFHTDDFVLEIKRNGNGWAAERKPNMQKRCLMIPMAYFPQDTRPFGKSRISPAVQAITSEMQRAIMRASIHAEVFSSGQKAILGVSDANYEKLNANKYRAAISELMVLGRDENGDVPVVTSFAQQSMEPHLKYQESLMSRMAAETSVPVAAYGLSSNGYTSADALRASTDDLILLAESLNRSNGQAIVQVAKLALAIATNRTVAELDDDEKSLQVHWKNPAMPSAASVADATAKIAGVVPEFGGTEVFWELNGFNEEQRRRVMSDIDGKVKRALTEALLTSA